MTDAVAGGRSAGRPRVVVVGGGITGLATAWFLRDRADVTVLEASDRPGGKIRTDDFEGLAVEAGPDAFLARVREAVQLCRDVGLGDELVAPAAGEAYLWTRGKLRRLPAGLVLGVPTGLVGVARSGILPPLTLLRAGLDLVLPRSALDGDASVGDIVARRFGRDTHRRLVDPLLGGIHAGRSESLSAAATAPQLASAARQHRSLVLGLRADRRAAPAPAGGAETPVFLTVRSGLERLVERLADGLDDLRLGRRVSTIERSGGGWTVDGIDADGVVVTVDAGAAAALLRPSSPDAAGRLDAIPYSSVCVVTLAYDRADVPDLPSGSGFLVPRIEGRLMTACTFGSSKWPQWQLPGKVVLRASTGRDGDERAMQLDDEAHVAAIHAELTEAIGLRAPRPAAARVTRWPRAFAQDRPGHLDRVAEIEEALRRDMPGVVVAGAPYRGVGIPACIRSAGQVADQLCELAASTRQNDG